MSELQIWPAPGKLNLFLRITGRRTDGYHELQTLFQFIDAGDELRFRLRPSGGVQMANSLADVPNSAHLCVRAATVLARHCGVRTGVEISLAKCLPMGAGLGGGSSDAATTLVALNVLWQLGLSTDALARLGLTLGADVPVFVRGLAAWAEGVGENLTPVCLPEPWYVVIYPGCVVPTEEIFGADELTRNSDPIRIPGSVQGADDTFAQICATAGNDCEDVVFARYPAVAAAHEWLRERLSVLQGAAAMPRMTGTGSAIFGSCTSERQARRVAGQVPAPWWSVAARGMNRSLLLDACARYAKV
ncbi:MAG: 4-diphosphocytidyl-2-C-methyl-D-erythritol kinase [Gammaproteobacteria bacterium]|jgi:4-diphosphocytidyl-2-C-methyl-D-erythritol kinase